MAVLLLATRLLAMVSFISSTAALSTPPPLTTIANKATTFPDGVQLVPPARATALPSSIYCNRDLNMEAISAVGFDMDYTLAQYKISFDGLAYDGAKSKLVQTMGYPAEALDFEYNPSQWTRGLIIDVRRGNFLKVDNFKYVRVALHGSSPLSPLVRKQLYSRSSNKVRSFTSSSYIPVDTLFQIVDVSLYRDLVDMKDMGDSEFLDGKTYEEIYRDVRACVDLCHRDGVIKDKVALDPEKYVVKDPDLVPMLENYKRAGLKVFLLTNSLWEYTQTCMTYLIDENWQDLFDVVIVGSCKPSFLIDGRRDLFRVDTETGKLTNTDGVYEVQALEPNGAEKFLSKGKVFQNGNWQHLNSLMGIKAGEEILYVGDHLFSDVLRSKRTLGWRTALIVPELEHECEVYRATRDDFQVPITKLRALREELSIYADALEIEKEESYADDVPSDLEARLVEVYEEEERAKVELTRLTQAHHERFNAVWGQLFVAGYTSSRFATQCMNYADVYMTKASALRYVSSKRSFKSVHEGLPHVALMDIAE